jgi:hypothetical protein
MTMLIFGLITIFCVCWAFYCNARYVDYRDSLHSVIKGVQNTEPKISRAVKTKICIQATTDNTEAFLNQVVKEVTEGQ